MSIAITNILSCMYASDKMMAKPNICLDFKQILSNGVSFWWVICDLGFRVAIFCHLLLLKYDMLL